MIGFSKTLHPESQIGVTSPSSGVASWVRLEEHHTATEWEHVGAGEWSFTIEVGPGVRQITQEMR